MASPPPQNFYDTITRPAEIPAIPWPAPIILTPQQLVFGGEDGSHGQEPSLYWDPANKVFNTKSMRVSLGVMEIDRSPIGCSIGESQGGVVDVVHLTTELTTTAPTAMALANGLSGQFKVITMVSWGGNATVTPASALGFSSIVFTANFGSVTLQYHFNGGWMVVYAYGAVTVNP